MRHVFLGEANRLGASAVHVHRHTGIVERLLDARVGCAGNIADLIQHAFGESVISIHVGTNDLYVDGRREAEVENLGDNVHRQHVKGYTRILAGQHTAKALDIGRGGMMVFGQLHLDVGVRRSNGRRGRVRKVQSGVRQADIIQNCHDLFGGDLLTDGGVNLVAERGCFLDARARVSAHVNLELAGVYRGEEVLAQPWLQHDYRTDREQQEQDKENRRVVHAEGEQAQIAVAKALKARFKTALEADEGIATVEFPARLGVVVLLEQVFGHGGHQRPREQIAGEHGEDHGFGHGNEEESRHAAQEEHGHEDNADGQGGNQSGNGNLRRAVEDGLLQLFAGLKVAVDVFNGNCGVIHQDADGQSHASQGHDVDGLVQHGEHAERTENGERNGDRDDDRGAKTAQENQNHDGGEAGGDDGLADHTVDGAAHKDRLIGEETDLQLRRHSSLQTHALQLVAHSFDDVQRGGRAGFHHAHHDGAFAVNAHNIGLRRVAVAHVGYVADIDHSAVHRLDGQIVQVVDHLRSGVGLDGVFEAVDLHRAGWHDQVLRRDGIDHIGGRESLGLERVQVKVHLNLALLAAIGKRRLRSLDGCQLGADVLLAQVVQLLLVEAFAGKTEHQNGHAGSVVLDDEWRIGTGRQAAQLHLADGRYLGYGVADIDVRLEENLDDSQAVERLRLDVLDVVDRGGHAALAVGHDAVGHLRRGEAVEVPHHRHHRDIDVGKDVRRHRQDAEDAENQNQKREHDKGVRSPQRKPDNPHRAGTRS